MARRYRYAFATKKESPGGKISTGISAASFLLFLTAIIVSFLLEGKHGYIVGGICLFATLLSIYGFILGLVSFSGKQYLHTTSVIGSIANGIIMVAWLGFFLMGLG